MTDDCSPDSTAAMVPLSAKMQYGRSKTEPLWQASITAVRVTPAGRAATTCRAVHIYNTIQTVKLRFVHKRCMTYGERHARAGGGIEWLRDSLYLKAVVRETMFVCFFGKCTRSILARPFECSSLTLKAVILKDANRRNSVCLAHIRIQHNNDATTKGDYVLNVLDGVSCHCKLSTLCLYASISFGRLRSTTETLSNTTYFDSFTSTFKWRLP